MAYPQNDTITFEVTVRDLDNKEYVPSEIFVDVEKEDGTKLLEDGIPYLVLNIPSISTYRYSWLIPIMVEDLQRLYVKFKWDGVNLISHMFYVKE